MKCEYISDWGIGPGIHLDKGNFCRIGQGAMLRGDLYLRVLQNVLSLRRFALRSGDLCRKRSVNRQRHQKIVPPPREMVYDGEEIEECRPWRHGGKPRAALRI